MNKRKSYLTEDKIRILKQSFLEKKKISEICQENDIKPTVFYRWQKVFFENAVHFFQKNENTNLEKKIDFWQKKLAQKNEVISELMEELIIFKKKIGES